MRISSSSVLPKSYCKRYEFVQAERLFKRALKSGEVLYKKSQPLQHHSATHEAEHRECLIDALAGKSCRVLQVSCFERS